MSGFFEPPPLPNFYWVYMKKIKVVPNWLKWLEKWWEIILTPPPTEKKLFGQHEKNQSCPELAEMARKLVNNNFRNFAPPPDLFWVNIKKSKLSQIG